MTDRPDARGGIGGLDEFLDKINGSKKIARLMGPDEKGNKSVDLPSWFERRGVRTFSINSGLGLVSCRVPRFNVADTKGEEIPDEQMIPLILSAIVKVPEAWACEETFALKCGITMEEGKALPSPVEVMQKTTAHGASGKPNAVREASDDQRDYLVCLPKSLAGQVFIALGFMAQAPLPLDPTPSA